MDYKRQRELIKSSCSNKEAIKGFLMNNVGIDVTRDGYFKVRPEEKTPSCIINQDTSFHDYGSGEHYGDLVSLLYDGYHAFDSLPETMEWLCSEFNIEWKVSDE